MANFPSLPPTVLVRGIEQSRQNIDNHGGDGKTAVTSLFNLLAAVKSLKSGENIRFKAVVTESGTLKPEHVRAASHDVDARPRHWARLLSENGRATLVLTNQLLPLKSQVLVNVDASSKRSITLIDKMTTPQNTNSVAYSTAPIAPKAQNQTAAPNPQVSDILGASPQRALFQYQSMHNIGGKQTAPFDANSSPRALYIQTQQAVSALKSAVSASRTLPVTKILSLLQADSVADFASHVADLRPSDARILLPTRLIEPLIRQAPIIVTENPHVRSLAEAVHTQLNTSLANTRDFKVLQRFLSASTVTDIDTSIEALSKLLANDVVAQPSVQLIKPAIDKTTQEIALALLLRMARGAVATAQYRIEHSESPAQLLELQFKGELGYSTGYVWLHSWLPEQTGKDHSGKKPLSEKASQWQLTIDITLKTLGAFCSHIHLSGDEIFLRLWGELFENPEYMKALEQLKTSFLQDGLNLALIEVNQGLRPPSKDAYFSDSIHQVNEVM